MFGMKGGHGFLRELLEVAEKEEKFFVTYHIRPAKSSAIGTRSDRVNHNKQLALILQGPIVRDGDFTLETLKLYRRHFGPTQIILSTWEDEDEKEIKRFKDLGIDILLNRKPAYGGQSNINLQIVSSRAGVEMAKESGAEYALKTRTDQRIYAPDVAHFLYNITEVFPVRGEDGLQKKRIVGVSLNTFKYRMYGMSDMLVYGHVEDMGRYWDAPLDDRIFTEEFVESRGKSLRVFANWCVCEVYLATGFLRKVGHVPEWTLADSWKAFSERFCVVDREQLDLFWPKYNRLEYRAVTYEEFNTKQELTFRDWLSIYYDLGSLQVPEHLLDVPL